jgi:hypothetical protein
VHYFAHWHVWTILGMARTLRGQLQNE